MVHGQDEVERNEVIYWSTDEGIERIETSRHKTDFFYLSNNFAPQNNKIFCGPATVAIVLNALRIRNYHSPLPEDKTQILEEDREYLSNKMWGRFFNSPVFERYTQNNIFTERSKKRSTVLGEPYIDAGGDTRYNPGFQIREIQQLLTTHNVNAVLRIVTDDIDKNQVKNELINNLKNKNDYVIVNYLRSSLHQKGGGHISPLGAYHKDSDSFLIMDVSPNVAEWVWVKSDLLIDAMMTKDIEENRGYILVSEGNPF